MPTVRMLQDWKSRKNGETWSPSDSTARLLVASGKAVLVEDPATLAPVIETDPPVVAPETVAPDTDPPVLETTGPIPESNSPAPESIDPVVESNSSDSEIQEFDLPEPGFQWPADISVPGPVENIEPLRPSRYAPHRSWIKPSES